MNEVQQDALAHIKRLVLELRLALDALDEPLVPQVKAVSVDETTLTGVIGRPETKAINGTRLFTAGLGIKDGRFTTWTSLEAWGKVADQARELQRGDIVTIKGCVKTKNFVNADGVMKSQSVFAVREFVGESSQSAS